MMKELSVLADAIRSRFQRKRSPERLGWLWERIRTRTPPHKGFDPQAHGRGVEDAIVTIATMINLDEIEIKKKQ